MKEHRAKLERRAARAKHRGDVVAVEEKVSSVPLLVADAEPEVDPGSLGLVSADKLDRPRAQPVRNTRSERRK